MGLDKLATSQDDSISEITNLAAQPFLEREFALFLLDNCLGFGLVKRRRVVLAANRPAQKQMLAILCRDLLRAGALRQTQNDPEPFHGRSGPFGQRLRITAIPILLGILAQARSNRI